MTINRYQLLLASPSLPPSLFPQALISLFLQCHRCKNLLIVLLLLLFLPKLLLHIFLTWTWQKQPTIALKQDTTDQLCWKCTQSLCKFPTLQFYSYITQNTLVLLVVLSSAIISKDMLSFLIRSHFSCPRETPQFEPTDITSEAERLLLLCSTSIFPADPQHPIYFIVISINKNRPEGLKTNKQK